MKTIGKFQFPDSPNDDWKPVIRYRALHRCVLVVARTRIEGAWKAYCKNVPGESHEREAFDEDNGPLSDGDNVGEKVARVLFPEFDGIPYAK